MSWREPVKGYIKDNKEDLLLIGWLEMASLGSDIYVETWKTGRGQPDEEQKCSMDRREPMERP